MAERVRQFETAGGGDLASRPEQEKRRFVRHLRPYWEVHRHRAAPAIAKLMNDERATQPIQVHAGRITNYEEDERPARVTAQPAGNMVCWQIVSSIAPGRRPIAVDCGILWCLPCWPQVWRGPIRYFSAWMSPLTEHSPRRHDLRIDLRGGAGPQGQSVGVHGGSGIASAVHKLVEHLLSMEDKNPPLRLPNLHSCDPGFAPPGIPASSAHIRHDSVDTWA